MKITNHINNNSNNRMGYIIHLKKLPSAKPKKPESPGYPPAKL